MLVLLQLKKNDLELSDLDANEAEKFTLSFCPVVAVSLVLKVLLAPHI